MPSNTLKKNATGHGYKYTDLAEIHSYLEESGLGYYQEIESTERGDYVVTTVLDKDGKAVRKVRGARVVDSDVTARSNPAQQMGAALTYARRYSLLMAFGLATDDDDAASLTREPATAHVPLVGRTEVPRTEQRSFSDEKPQDGAYTVSVSAVKDGVTAAGKEWERVTTDIGTMFNNSGVPMTEGTWGITVARGSIVEARAE